MSVIPMSQVRPARSQGSWDRRNVAELSQTNFRTTLRGFDRDEVRAILESVAADYRVLQLQNASLKRQLADLEGVLQAYQGDEGPANGTALARHVLERANADARAILMRAHAQAEEAMARVVARAREAERPMEQFEEDQRNFRALLASTVSELLAVLSMTRRVPPTAPPAATPIAPRVIEAPAATPAPSAAIVTASAPDDRAPSLTSPHAAVVERPAETTAPRESGTHATDVAAPLALAPIALVPHDERPRHVRREPAPDDSVDAESIQSLLRNIDRALVAIPALPFK